MEPTRSSPEPLTCVVADLDGTSLFGQADGGTAFYRYDAASDAWEQLADSPVAAGNNCGAARVDGRIYTARQAREVGLEALEIYERLDDLVGLGHVLNNLGVHAYYRGDWDEALERWTRFEEVRRRTGDVSGAAAAVNNLAEVYSDQGKVEQAEPMFRQALYEWDSSGIQAGVGLAHLNLGRVLTRMGRLDEAGEQLERGLEVFKDMGAQAYVFEAQVRRAELLLFARRREAACDLANTVLAEMPADSSTLMQRASLHRVLGYRAAADRDTDLAARELKQSLALATEADAQFEAALTLEALARLLRNDPEAQVWNAGQAERLARLGVIATAVVPVD